MRGAKVDFGMRDIRPTRCIQEIATQNQPNASIMWEPNLGLVQLWLMAGHSALVSCMN